MASPWTTSIRGTTGVPLPFFTVNPHVAPVNLGLIVYQSGGTGMYIVQHTFDSPFDRSSTGQLIYATPSAFVSTARWNNHSTLSSLTSTADGNYAYPPAAVRLNVVSADGNAVFELKIIQAGIAGN